MEFDQLRLFVDLVRLGSFTKVAELNSLTQPAVSLSIQKLEEELGARLLERTTRKVLVTDEGRILLGYAQEILEASEEVKAVLLERHERVMGSLRLATVTSVGVYELPAILKEFICRYPQVNIHIEYKSTDQVTRMVLDGESDLGLVVYGESGPGLTAEQFYEDELVVVCNAEHPFAGRESLRLRDLNGQSFVAFESDMATRKAIDAVMRLHDVRVHTRMQCDNIDILKKMVEVGLGIAMAPLLSVREESRSGVLKVLHVTDHVVMRPLSIIRRAGKALPRSHQAFLDLVKQEGARLLFGSAPASNLPVVKRGLKTV